jgi:serine phosphatase RsbU (regulator of sigma subunit)
MPQVRYINEVGHIESVSLTEQPLLIGRAPTCQVILDSDTISREHARIDPEADGRYRIRDLGSRNKTHVCGQLVSETLLSSGDIIRLGDRVLEFVDDGANRDRIDVEFLTPDRTEPPDCEWTRLKSPISLSAVQLEGLARLFAYLHLTSRPEDIADGALSRMLLDLAAERGFVALRGEAKREMRVIAQRGLRRPPGGSLTPVSQSFVYSALLQGASGRYPQSAGNIDAKAGYAACGLTAPLTHRGDVIGVVYVDRPTAKKPFPATAIPQLAAAGAQLGALMAETSRRLVDTASREGAAWMSTVRRMHESLLIEPAGNATFDIAYRYLPGRARCGDLCDVIHLDEGRTAVLLVDTGGHGVAGLAQASAIRAAVRTALTVSEDTLMDPGPVFAVMNETVARSRTRQIVPCTFVGIDVSSGRIAYINAGGMPPLLMVAPGRLVTLDQPALVLGVDPTYAYEVTRVDFPERFRLVVVSDGLIEAGNAAQESLGSARLHEALLEQVAFASVQDALDRVLQLHKAHLGGAEPDDDATVFIIGRGTAGA